MYNLDTNWVADSFLLWPLCTLPLFIFQATHNFTVLWPFKKSLFLQCTHFW